MIPKHSETLANADWRALMRLVAKARPTSPPRSKRHAAGKPQRVPLAGLAPSAAGR